MTFFVAVKRLRTEQNQHGQTSANKFDSEDVADGFESMTPKVILRTVFAESEK